MKTFLALSIVAGFSIQAEAGFAGCGVTNWVGFSAAADVASQRINKLSTAAQSALESAQVNSGFMNIGYEQAMGILSDLSAFIRHGVPKYANVLPTLTEQRRQGVVRRET